ncbi:MAG TPA: hypothetical protein VKU80_08180 [Planctomycetota bacterium]|nr:hypothetical protein [Planctomycetota bacterium]
MLLSPKHQPNDGVYDISSKELSGWNSRSTSWSLRCSFRDSDGKQHVDWIEIDILQERERGGMLEDPKMWVTWHYPYSNDARELLERELQGFSYMEGVRDP